MAFTVLHKRTGTADRRPRPSDLSDGQLAVNYNNSTPGLFFKTSTGQVAKAGPAIVSSTLPAVANYDDFSVGELWIDTSSASAIKYWNGGQWVIASIGNQIVFNQSLIPIADNTFDIGSSGNRVRNLYTGDINLSNEGRGNDVDGSWGSYTIQEGEDDLFLINRRTGRKFRFLLEEVK
jgi:hypothetical protein